MSQWVTSALTVMNKTLMACRESGKTPAETAKAIDEAYPFGERAHHPYKVWLRERRLFFAQHGLPRNGKRKTPTEEVDDLIALLESKLHWAK